MKLLLAMAWLGVSSAAFATDTISVARVTPYEDGAANAEIRQECKWNAKLGDNIAHYAKGQLTVTDKDLAQVNGRILLLKISQVHAIGGGGFSGPKWARVKGELREGDKLLGSFEVHRTTSFGGFSACGVLDKLGKEIGEDIAEWLEHPTMDAQI